MEVRFRHSWLDRLETEPGDGKWPAPVVRRYRMTLAWIRAADDERDLYGNRSLHYEKLKGNRKHQRSMRLNDQYRLILEIEGEGADRVVHIVGIEDYH